MNRSDSNQNGPALSPPHRPHSLTPSPPHVGVARLPIERICSTFSGVRAWRPGAAQAYFDFCVAIAPFTVLARSAAVPLPQ